MDGIGDIKQIDNLLASNNVFWLLGAGVSKDAGIPLMKDLTARVKVISSRDSEKKHSEIISDIESNLPDDPNIENILSHLCDLIAVSERSRNKRTNINSREYSCDELVAAHEKVLMWISEIIRLGYMPESGGISEKIGTKDAPIISIDNHRDFIKAVFNKNQAGLIERRTAIRIFTTNYDTLIEDALAIERICYWDGFSGGAVAFRTHKYGAKEPNIKYGAHLIKLHGSIDWHISEDYNIWRVRDTDLYPRKDKKVLIYPQATKYLATQRDPFAAQFELLRRNLNYESENILAICGYSFGDEHINQEIELSLNNPENKTTVIVFSININEVLGEWMQEKWSGRLYIICEDGIYYGNNKIYKAAVKKEWWKFTEITKILNDGIEAML